MVRLLWHGTRLTPPTTIATGENGLDMRFSHAGMHGNGIYFARDANYSMNGYSHALGNGVSQLLLCLVLVGKTV